MAHNTGIVRRIDDLGRVIIPKEVRTALGIKEGDAFEVLTEKNGDVIFRKYFIEEKEEEDK